MRCTYCKCTARLEPGALYCPECLHDASVHGGPPVRENASSANQNATPASQGGGWLVVAVIVVAILGVWYFNRDTAPTGLEERPQQVEAPQPSSAPNEPKAPIASAPESAEIQGGYPQAPSVFGVQGSNPSASQSQQAGPPSPPPLDPSGYPPGYQCPSGTTWLEGQCITIQNLPPPPSPEKSY
jgi:hypothetical protein